MFQNWKMKNEKCIVCLLENITPGLQELEYSLGRAGGLDVENLNSTLGVAILQNKTFPQPIVVYDDRNEPKLLNLEINPAFAPKWGRVIQDFNYTIASGNASQGNTELV